MKLNNKLSILALTSLAALTLVGCNKQEAQAPAEPQVETLVEFKQCVTPEQEAKLIEAELINKDIAKGFCVEIEGRAEKTPYKKVNDFALEGIKGVLTQFFSTYVTEEHLDDNPLEYDVALADFKQAVSHAFDNPTETLVSLPRFAELKEFYAESDASGNVPVFLTLPSQLLLDYQQVSHVGKLNFYRFDSYILEPGAANGMTAFPEFHAYNTETDELNIIPASMLKDESLGEVIDYIKNNNVLSEDQKDLVYFEDAELYFDKDGLVLVVQGHTYNDFVEVKLPYDKAKDFIKDEYLADLGLSASK